MPDITGPIGDAFGSFINSEVVQLTLLAIGFYFVILWLAAAFWAFRDMHDRTENPIVPYIAAGLIILFSPLFFVFGVIVYRIIRPAERLGEVYERNLAEEALLAEVEAIKTCPGCRRRTNEEWIICPTCRTRLNRVCPNCERLVGLDWSICAWCAKDFEPAPSYDRSAQHAPATSPSGASAGAHSTTARAANAFAAGKPATGR